MPPTRSSHSSHSPPKRHRSSANTPGKQSTAPSSSAKISKASTAASAAATRDAPGKIKPAKNDEDQPKSAALPSTRSGTTTPRRFSLVCGFGLSPPSSLWLKYYPSHRGIAGEGDVVCYPAEDSLSGDWHFIDDPLSQTPKLATWHLRVHVQADDTRPLEVLKAPEGTEMQLRTADEGAAAAGGANVSLQTPDGFKVRFDLWQEDVKRASVREEVESDQGGSSRKKVKVEE